MSKQFVQNELIGWEKELMEYQPNDIELLYDKWISQTFDRMNPQGKERFFGILDDLIFHTHSYMQGTTLQADAKKEILNNGRVFLSDINTIYDMKKLTVEQLNYIAYHHIAKSKLYSCVQGGLTGTGGFLLMGVDFPLMVAMNLRVVQQIGMTFGHEMKHPYEMLLSLRVFHTATLPKRFQKNAWNQLIKDVEKEGTQLYSSNLEFTDPSWMNLPLKQLLKTIIIKMGRRKLVQGIPILSIGIGAYSNYQLTRQVTEFALRFYQKRHIIMNEE